MLTSTQLEFFETNGYLIVEDVFDADSVIKPVIAEYEAVLDGLIENWVSTGKLTPPATDAGFQEKLVHAYKNGCDYFQPLDISLPTGDIEPDCPFHAGPAIFNLMTNNNLLNIVEQLIGDEITSNPIQHVRIKPPATDLAGDEVRAHITKTSWHQDKAVTLEEADETRMVTVWCAITDATVDNGCLQVIPGSHRAEMIPHCPLPQVGIPDQFIDEQAVTPMPVKSGGIVIFHPMTVHGSLANETDGIRWSFDLRFNKTGQPTGRPQFPDFVARSRANPDTELRDPERWHQMWMDTRNKLGSETTATYYRWSADAPYCA